MTDAAAPHVSRSWALEHLQEFTHIELDPILLDTRPDLQCPLVVLSDVSSETFSQQEKNLMLSITNLSEELIECIRQYIRRNLTIIRRNDFSVRCGRKLRNRMDAFLDGLSNCSCAQFAILVIAFVHREARVAARTLHRGIVPRSILRCSPRAIAEVYQGCENIRGHLEILHVRRSRMGRSDE